MKQNKTLFLVGGALLLAGAAYLLLRNKGKQDQAALDRLGIPPADDQAPATLPPATPAPAALVVGDVVKAKNKFPMFTEALGVYNAGGSNGKGEMEAGLYAGKIIGFYTGLSSGTNYAKVQTFTNRPKDANGKLVDVYLTPTSNLTK